ncbi:hypothetical protein Peur_028562 [Populus x canadensis]
MATLDDRVAPAKLESFLAGLSASGALISASRLITKAAFDNSQDELRKRATSEGSKTVSADLAAVGIETLLQPESEEDPEQLERLGNKELLLQNIDYAIDTFLDLLWLIGKG